MSQTSWSSSLSEYAIATTLYNYLNLTASSVANLNATAQELLSYFEDRAQAIVPEFLNDTWTPQLYDAIAIDSGLVPAIEGLELAFGEQQYQVWNATFASWDSDISITGEGGLSLNGWSFPTNESGGNVIPSNSANYINDAVTLLTGGTDVSRPWQYWATHEVGGSGQSSFYFNLMPGGTIVNANITNGTGQIGSFTVTDVTQNFSFPVPFVSGGAWDLQSKNSIPIVTTIHHINQFDLLKLTCTSDCGQGTLEASGGFAFLNPSSIPPTAHYVSTYYGDSWDNNNTLAYSIEMFGQATSPPGLIEAYYPTVNAGWCYTNYYLIVDTGCALDGAGNSQTIPSEGSITSIGGDQPGSVYGNDSLSAYPTTMKNLVNNTMTMAYNYWLVLRALTENGTYSIPPDCAIPTPSQAFPDATDFSNYQLNSADVFAVYLSYLNAVAHAYNTSFTNGFYLCNDAHLALTYDWALIWKPLLNITASFYFAGPKGPIYLNGTNDTSAQIAHPNTWPVRNINPTLLYPYNYQMNIPINNVYPIPVNNPAAALLINYSGNMYYGNSNLTLGVPTYVSLNGYGNYSEVSGFITNISSGVPVANGSAIYISTCTNAVTGMPENPCRIAVTYYNNYSYGIVHALFFPNPGCPSCVNLGGLGGQAEQLCGTGAMNQWYDAWAGHIITGAASIFVYIGDEASSLPVVGGALNTFFSDLGCLVGYVVLILIFVGLFILCAWLIRLWRG